MHRFRYLIRDRDAKFSAAFDAVFAAFDAVFAAADPNRRLRIARLGPSAVSRRDHCGQSVDLPPKDEVEADECEDAEPGRQRRGIDEHCCAGGSPVVPSSMLNHAARFAEGRVGMHGQIALLAHDAGLTS